MNLNPHVDSNLEVEIIDDISDLANEEFIAKIYTMVEVKEKPNYVLFTLGTTFLTIGVVILVNGLNIVQN